MGGTDGGTSRHCLHLPIENHQRPAAPHSTLCNICRGGLYAQLLLPSNPDIMSNLNRSRFGLVLAATLSLSVGANAGAQTLSELPANTRVRLILVDSLRQGPILPSRQFVAGQLTRITADSVTMRLMGSSDFSIARSQIKGAQVSRGKSRVFSAVTFGVSIGLMSALVVSVDRRGEPNRS